MKNKAENRFIPMTSIDSGIGQQVISDLYYFPFQIVNVVFYGQPGEGNDWVLIDAGMPRSGDNIIKEAEERFGKNNPPKALILTHGHFDHIGGITELIEKWKMPVYAHELELPFLQGEQDYPEPDPTVEGGLLAKISPYYPNEAIVVEGDLRALPMDGSVPFMEGWKWIHTPGHTQGHVSLYRESDGALIAGDAFVTVKQESLYKVFTQEQEISGPPRYLTPDWEAARTSVEKLASLHPTIAITGHGRPMEGETLRENLQMLVEKFDEIAIPDYGKFVDGKKD
ncbi:MBL fold metallo-hydrolase [Neobacillus notoginsengisoli]|uniref:MBL fold metallo-hydrolase n=1 Tax=Neobacillus notoginsengisoli TaxID=1578198 RepID=A0A417YWX8_9BACI|nr:MBL fold metallo-hydrolase [Neobacillus notoginsengisoli]RHW42084.1 MBL fold metallo-hydrolase [Neobacillus notoginsengisoli]